MSDTFSFTLESPLTGEQLNLITDAEFEHTDSITYITPKGKEVEFRKVKKGKWEYVDYGGFGNWHCTACGEICICNGDSDYCPNCGARMVSEE